MCVYIFDMIFYEFKVSVSILSPPPVGSVEGCGEAGERDALRGLRKRVAKPELDPKTLFKL